MPFGAAKAALLGAAGSSSDVSYDGRYEFIATFSSASSSYTFSSLPAGYESYEIRLFVPNQSAQRTAYWQVNSVSSYWTNQWASYNGNKWSTSSSSYSQNRFSWMGGPTSVSGTASFVNVNQNAKVAGMSLGSNNYSGASTYGVVKQLSAFINTAQSSGITSILVGTTESANFPTGTTCTLFGIKDAV